jgi:hypothetical protein
MEEDILAAIVRLDKAESFLPHYFLDRSSHVAMPPTLLSLGDLAAGTPHELLMILRFPKNMKSIGHNMDYSFVMPAWIAGIQACRMHPETSMSIWIPALHAGMTQSHGGLH